MSRAGNASPSLVSERDLRALLELAARSDLTELEVEHGEVRVRIRREPGEAGAMAPAAATQDETTLAGEPEAPSLVFIRSPLVGVFRAHVKVGEAISAGQVVGVVDALRMSHPVESESAGVVEAILVEDDHAVEYGQPLIHLRADALA